MILHKMRLEKVLLHANEENWYGENVTQNLKKSIGSKEILLCEHRRWRGGGRGVTALLVEQKFATFGQLS